MLAIEGADKKRNRLLLVKHTHIQKTRPFNKTHPLMLAIEEADKERNRLLLVKHTQHNSVKLTSWSMLAMQGAARRKTGYFWSNIRNTRQFSKTYLLMLAIERIKRR